MKIATSISDEVYLGAETLALRLGVSKSELLRRALVAFIEAWEAKGANHGFQDDEIRDTLNEIYSSTNSDVDEVLAALQRASLPRETW